MAVVASKSQLLLLCLLSIGIALASAATLFTLQNQCSYTVWPGTITGNGPPLGGGGFALTPGGSVLVEAPVGWSGRFWGRTGCSFDASGVGTCVTGDCPGGLKCTGGGATPTTLVEFTVAAPNVDGKDFYDVSLVDGYNLPVEVVVTGPSRTGDCNNTDCRADINAICPPELRVTDNSSQVVACKSACEQFKEPKYCCTGDFSKPETCPPTDYSKIFKQACPKAYSYAYDDATSTFTCTGADYQITFCPANS
ncbi:hypothetical protein BT93_L3581 [Corymbia citriodora subsp. variegata]|uniref:Thaumatin-like protein n=1 Tax=Corymbia citriodora subsp. variegata TaxID=360336 RepID=A0A8T0CWR9_CORYI|nr:hypothetical protein BT93_L3581 [Corymbia citriodora subsp. variegata]